MVRLSDEQWERIREHFPEEHIPEGRGGRKPIPTRQVLEAVLWIHHTGTQWRMLPQYYPNYKTVHRRFQQSCRQEVLRDVRTDLANTLREQDGIDEEERFIDAMFASAKGGGSSARYTFVHIPEHRHILPYNVAFQNPAFRRENGGPLPSHPLTPEAQNSGGGGRVGLREITMDNADDGLKVDSQSVSLTVDWNIGDNLTLRSITGATEVESEVVVDFGSTNYQQFVDNNFDEEDNISQELHLSGSDFDGRVDWIVGGYYLKRGNRGQDYRWTHPEFYEAGGSLGDFNCFELPCPTPNREMIEFVRAWGLENDPASWLDNDPLTNPPEYNCMSNWSPLPLFTDSLSGGEDVDRAVFAEATIDITDRFATTVGVRFTQGDGREF